MTLSLPRELKVSRQTARLVSQSTYHDLILALRELIANAHDAAAPKIFVDIDLSKDYRRLPDDADPESRGFAKIFDLGKGMSREEFDDAFLNVGESEKNEKSTNRMGRPLIGQFGIGFISALPFCEEVIVETRAEGSDIIHGVTIPSKQILLNIDPPEERKNEVRDIAGEKNELRAHRFPIDGWTREVGNDDEDSFTEVILNGLTPLAIESTDARWAGGYHAIGNRKKDAEISNSDRIGFLKEWLRRILPLGYPLEDNDAFEAPPTSSEHEALRRKLLRLLRSALPLDYKPAAVYFNGVQIHRALADVRYPKDETPYKRGGQTLEGLHLREFTSPNHGLKAKGVIWSQMEVILPARMRGVTIRSGDMSIGDPGYWGLGQGAKYYGKLFHVGGEFHVNGLDKNLRLDREQFKPGHATEEFLSFVRKEIAAMDEDLQKIANVVEKVRKVSKAVKKKTSQEKKFASHRVDAPAPIAAGSNYLKQLTQEAKTMGVTVEEAEIDDPISVPKGERKLKIDTKAGDDILTFTALEKSVKITVVDGENLALREIGAQLLQDDDAIEIRGRHSIFSDQADVIAYLRFLAALRIATKQGVIDEDQFSKILEILEETLEGKNEN